MPARCSPITNDFPDRITVEEIDVQRKADFWEEIPILNSILEEFYDNEYPNIGELKVLKSMENTDWVK